MYSLSRVGCLAVCNGLLAQPLAKAAAEARVLRWEETSQLLDWPGFVRQWSHWDVSSRSCRCGNHGPALALCSQHLAHTEGLVLLPLPTAQQRL
jgi:hypothetical protein